MPQRLARKCHRAVVVTLLQTQYAEIAQGTGMFSIITQNGAVQALRLLQMVLLMRGHRLPKYSLRLYPPGSPGTSRHSNFRLITGEESLGPARVSPIHVFANFAISYRSSDASERGPLSARRAVSVVTALDARPAVTIARAPAIAVL
jgi:hypothetical protein